MSFLNFAGRLLLFVAFSAEVFAADLSAGISALKSGKYAQALSILVPIANQGDDEAQRLIGEMAYNGQGMKKDLAAAFKWNEVSASSGNRIAQYNMGYLFEKGEGARASTAQAIAWYTKSALQDYVPAQHKLGDLYASSDRDKALYWYDRARLNGDEAAGRKQSEISSQKFAQLDAEKARDEAEERAKARREDERRWAELDAQRRREARDAQSVADYNAAIMGQIQRRGAEDAALLRRVDRQTQMAVAETNRALAAQTRERDHARVEPNDSDRRRQADLPKYQQPAVVIPAGPTSCPPGFSPARHSNGQTIAVPAAAYCIKDPAAPEKAAAQSSSERDAGNAGSTRKPGTDSTTKLAKSETAPPLPKTKKIEWGPLQKEAMVICHQSKRGTYRCDGPVQLELIGGAKTIDEALGGQECRGGTWIAGGPVIDGEQWDAYRCGHAIGAGDRDIAPRYGLVAMQRNFMCPKGTPGDGRCATFYDGQDKR